jgi:hypothetical protein
LRFSLLEIKPSGGVSGRDYVEMCEAKEKKEEEKPAEKKKKKK